MTCIEELTLRIRSGGLLVPIVMAIYCSAKIKPSFVAKPEFRQEVGISLNLFQKPATHLNPQGDVIFVKLMFSLDSVGM